MHQLPSGAALMVARGATLRDIYAGEAVVRQGEEGDAYYFLLRGKVSARRAGHSSRFDLTLRRGVGPATACRGHRSWWS